VRVGSSAWKEALFTERKIMVPALLFTVWRGRQESERQREFALVGYRLK